MATPLSYPKKASSLDRVRIEADALGLAIDIKTMSQSTRTAEEAAEACGCTVAQIVKSLIFERHDTGELVLLLIAGNNRADLEKAAAIIGSSLDRADPKKVRAETGFAIGGVAPIGHLHPPAVYMDPDLLAFDTVWAAAGRPDAVFETEPGILCELIGASLLGEPTCDK